MAVLLVFLVPLPASESTQHRVVVVTVSAAYLLLAIAVGALTGIRRHGRALAWLARADGPDEHDARRALRIPVDIATISLGLWLLGAVVVGLVTASVADTAALGLRVALTIVLGGLVTAAVCYLLAERLARPVTVQALTAVPPAGRLSLGVVPRLVLTWLLGSGIPLLGVLLLFADPTDRGDGPTRGAVVLLTTIALLVGGLVTVLAARSVGAPLRALRRAVERVGDGDYAVRVSIDDAGEIGLLQDRVNVMTAGLQERERLMDLFGRHVGADVARRALDTGVALGGELRTAGVLFVDVAGSTALALDRGPQETVAVLNRFFQVVVDDVESRGGLVNKFEGDAALCVFGAPVDLTDPAGAALAAARAIATHVAAAGEVDVGIGVAFGEVVAGQIGATSRLEYTVIGDPVNEAARLTEQAKRLPGRVLASAAALDACDPAERVHWSEGHTLDLRGRSMPTATFVPAS